ncbi:MAG: nucleotide sugar dehydrogenase, partial [Firmicutes bacterium]|nr:nucleotide sugar dehydrogenase [Bacillota bacterium]
NTFRDVNIAFANEMAQICENLGINAWELIRLCNMHPRVNILQPGPGVGGHCIAVDPWFIVEKQPETAKLIHTSRLINDARPTQVATKVLNYLEHVSDPQVTVLGVTYKPDVDDLRESPVLEIVTLLTAAGVSVRVYDPFVSDKFGGDLMKAVTGSDLLILGVHHSQFKQLPLAEIGAVMRSKQIYDTRRFIDEEAAQAAGFTYYLLGRD